MTRDEFSAAAIAHESHGKRILAIGLIAAFGCFAVLLSCWRPLRDVLTQFDESLPVVLLPPLLLTPFPIAGVLMWVVRVRAVDKAGAACPNCGRSVLGKWQYVMATSACPYCGTIVLSEE